MTVKNLITEFNNWLLNSIDDISDDLFDLCNEMVGTLVEKVKENEELKKELIEKKQRTWRIKI